MGKIIAVASGKGGTGKTTFTANVALALAHMGQRVLCLDCDITLRNLDLALGLSDRALMDFSDVLEGRCTLHEAAVPHERYPSLSLLTAPMADRPLSLSVPKLQALAREIRESYDWCLIDAPAGLGQGFQMAACMADQVIVITTTDVSAMRDAQRTAAELSAFPSGTVHLVVGRVSKKVLRQLHTTIDDAIDAAGLPFLKNLTPPAGSKTVDELKEIVKLMNGKPFILKGIMTVNGAKKALEAGASGIVVSNHGGRVLDQCPATAEVLPAIVDAVGGKMTILVDGGIRTGMDVFKALALGADAVLIGRPFVNMVYGGGAEGVQVYVDKLKAELADTMAMCGAHKLSDIKRSMLFGY